MAEPIKWLGAYPITKSTYPTAASVYDMPGTAENS